MFRTVDRIVAPYTSSHKCMAFLDTQGAQYTGAQGLSLVWEQRREKFLLGMVHASFDRPHRLWKDEKGDYRVPYIRLSFAEDFGFEHRRFTAAWFDDAAFLCFSQT